MLRDVRCRVAFIASQASMLAFERISGLVVIECLDIPLDHREIFPVVFGMAAGAFFARTYWDVVRGM